MVRVPLLGESGQDGVIGEALGQVLELGRGQDLGDALVVGDEPLYVVVFADGWAGVEAGQHGRGGECVTDGWFDLSGRHPPVDGADDGLAEVDVVHCYRNRLLHHLTALLGLPAGQCLNRGLLDG